MKNNIPIKTILAICYVKNFFSHNSKMVKIIKIMKLKLDLWVWPKENLHILLLIIFQGILATFWEIIMQIWSSKYFGLQYTNKTSFIFLSSIDFDFKSQKQKQLHKYNSIYQFIQNAKVWPQNSTFILFNFVIVSINIRKKNNAFLYLSNNVIYFNFLRKKHYGIFELH